MTALRSVLASLGLALACAGALAQAPEVTVTRAEATRRVLAGNPLLQARAAAVDATTAGTSLAALPRPWAIVTQLENVAGTGDYSGVREGELSVSAERELEPAARREARIRAARAEASAAELELLSIRRELRTESARRYLRAARLQLQIEERAGTLERLERARVQVEQWVRVGRSPDSERLNAEIAVARARLELDDASHEYEVARLALASLWGEPTTGFRLETDWLETLPEAAAFEQLLARLPRAEAARRLALEDERLAAERALARSSARPDVTLSIGARRLQGSADQALVIGARVPLGAPRRSGLDVQRIDALRRELAARRDALGLESHQQLYAAHQELNHARHVHETYRDEVVPRAEDAAALARRGYELGRMNYLSLSQAEQLLAEARAARLEAAERFHVLWLDVESLTAEFGVDAP